MPRPKLPGHRVVARVTLDVAVRREFDYLVPAELESSVHEGTRVKVPFGPREVMGVVTKVLDENTVQVELAENVRVKVLSTTLQDVLSKGAPVAGAKDDTKAENKSDDRSAKDGNQAPTQKKSMFGFGKK